MIHTHLSFISELTSRVPQGNYGEYIYQVSPSWLQKLVARTDGVFLPISEVSDGTVSLVMLLIVFIQPKIRLTIAYQLCIRRICLCLFIIDVLCKVLKWEVLH